MIEPPDLIGDPVGVVVDLVTSMEPALERAVVERVLGSVAGGRRKRRRLAQALGDRPGVLADGRSPAPRVVADFLVALREAGARRVSAPRCARCDKELRTFQRRGQDWYCSVCGPPGQPCSACGRTRAVTFRDRAGRPRCHGCPPEDLPHAVDIVVEVVRAIDPSISADTVSAAVAAVTSRAGQRCQLAWALQDRPELLTGAGAEAGVPSVLRLIEVLCDAGATGIERPTCPTCRRVMRLIKIRDGPRLCRNCVAKSRAEPCTRCGLVADPASRDEQGRPLCSHCVCSDPANCEVCVDCRRRRPVNTRAPDGPRCGSCRPLKTMTCAICGRTTRCEVSKVTGKPWCRACQQRWARCSGCKQVRPLRGGTLADPLCAVCAGLGTPGQRTCPSCGETARLQAGPCAHCRFESRLRDLLSDGAGEIRPELQALYENLAGSERPAAVLGWLGKSDAPAVLRSLATGERPLTHIALDELPTAKPVEHLRAVLVATGALPPRDEQMARLERWVAATIAARTDPDEQHVLRRYAIWHLLRRLRRGHTGAGTTYAQTTTVKGRVRAAVALLDWLASRDVTLASCDQGHLDGWLASDGATRQRDVGHFVRWAAAEKLTRLELPAVRWTGPSGPVDGDQRWGQARWLLRDDTVDVADRVAGLLVLLYAQRAATISRLTVDHVEQRDGVRLRLGPRPIVLPEPLAGLVLDLVATRRGHAALGDQGTSMWLFPGGQPARPISASRLTERLRELGISAGPARSAALFQLATELPAAVIARMLGVHIQVAVEWQRACSGDWARYAADYSRDNGAKR